MRPSRRPRHAGVAGAGRPPTTDWAGTAPVGDTRVAVYAADDPAGFGPALQIVTDNATMLMDSVTVLLHRLGVAYKAIMNPVFRVRRGPERRAAGRSSRRADAPTFGDGIDETWIHVQLSPVGGPPRRWPRSSGCCPACSPTPVRWRWTPTAMSATLRGLAAELDSDTEGRFPGPDRQDVAALLRWLADGHFVLLGYQRCPVRDGQCVGRSVQPPGRAAAAHDVLPQLTDSDDLLVLAQATMPSYLRYGAYPYIVVVREQSGGATRSRAPLRRAVHRRRDERQRARDPADLAPRQRRAGDGRTATPAIPVSCCSTSSRPSRARSCSR